MLRRRFGMLVNQTMRRIEAGRRRLRHIGNSLAQHVALHRSRGGHQIHPVEIHSSAGNAAAVAGKSHGSQTDRRFSSARFTNQSENFALFQIKIYPVHNWVPNLIGFAFDFQPAYFEELLCHDLNPSSPKIYAASNPPRNSPQQ